VPKGFELPSSSRKAGLVDVESVKRVGRAGALQELGERRGADVLEVAEEPALPARDDVEVAIAVEVAEGRLAEAGGFEHRDPGEPFLAVGRLGRGRCEGRQKQ
jgi:hypothetical protein